jgi:beta-glucosidase
MMKKSIFIVLSLLVMTAQAQTVKVPQLGKDPVEKVIAAMTLEEKAQLLTGSERLHLQEKVPGAAGSTVAIPRLGIPSIVLTDGPAGVRIQPIRKGTSQTYYCTGFPIGSLLSSTWNTTLIYQVGQAMGNEVKEYGCDVFLAPGMNIHRNPLCGRNFEYYSEDPVLSGRMAASIVNGVQSQGVGVSIKHFAANNQETLRGFTDARVSQRALREIYLKNFEIAVKESHPWTVMSSYNKINGCYTQESYPLLTELLRGEWNYKGLVMTDWTGRRNTVAQVHAGDDLLMPGVDVQVKDIIEGVKSGKLSQADLDRNVKNVLLLILKTPSFKKYAYSNHPDLKLHAQVCRQAASEGIILLKNENALPLSHSIKTVALFGIASYNFLAGGLGSGDVNKAYVVNMKDALEQSGYTIQPKVKTLYDKYTAFEDEQFEEVNKMRGWYFGKLMMKEPEMDSTYIKLRAKESDVAVVTFGRNAGEGTDRHNTEGDFLLTQNEKALLLNVASAYHAVGKKVIVVLNSGGVIETDSWKNIPDAIIMAWQPGQDGSRAVADILNGAVNPSGKLPVTFPVHYGDIPSSKNFPFDYKGFNGDENDSHCQQMKNVGYTNYEEGIWIGYRYFNTNHQAVSYPFGFGLSYTTFSYRNAKVKVAGKDVVSTLCVTNTGKVAGKEVVELFVSAPKGTMSKPLCELKAFAKTKLLQPGESEVVTLRFPLNDLASFDEASNKWIADAGDYQFLFGSSVQEILQKAVLNLHKQIAVGVTIAIK